MTTRTLSVVLPDADYIKIRDSAMKHHLPISSYVRSVVMRHINGDLTIPTATTKPTPAPTTTPKPSIAPSAQEDETPTPRAKPTQPLTPEQKAKFAADWGVEAE